MKLIHPYYSYLIAEEPLVRWFLSHSANPDASAAPNKSRTPVPGASEAQTSI